MGMNPLTPSLKRQEVVFVGHFRQLQAMLSRSGKCDFLTLAELGELGLTTIDPHKMPEGTKVACNCCEKMVKWVIRELGFYFCMDCIDRANVMFELKSGGSDD